MKIADNIITNILGKPRKRGGRRDYDGDGVPNKKDCQPRNTMRQDGGYKHYTYVRDEPVAKTMVSNLLKKGWDAKYVKKNEYQYDIYYKPK